MPFEERITYLPNKSKIPEKFNEYFDSLKIEGTSIILGKKDFTITVAYIPFLGFNNKVCYNNEVHSQSVTDEANKLIQIFDKKQSKLFEPIDSNFLCLGVFNSCVQYYFAKIYLRNMVMELFKKYECELITNGDVSKGCNKMLIHYSEMKNELKKLNDWFVKSVDEEPYSENAVNKYISDLKFKNHFKTNIKDLTQLIKP